MQGQHLNYDVVGGTHPDQEAWTDRFPGYRRYERTINVGQGPERWVTVAAGVLAWQVKTRSGFAVEPDAAAQADADYLLVVTAGPLTVREPVRVIQVVDLPARRGFSYGTRHGHPVSGEEAFITHLTPDENVWLTLRSLTRPAPGAWRWAFPGLLIAQHFYRHRYSRAMRPT